MEARSLDPTGLTRLIGEATPRRRSVFLVALMVLSVVFLGACDPQRPEKRHSDDRSTPAEVNTYQAEPDQALASGTVFSVRIRYGKSGATQCQVRVDNTRNGWYDEVEITAVNGLAFGNGYDDYDFTSDNFNRQITNPNNAPFYTPEAVPGEYKITVTADTGYSASTRIDWNGEEFSPNLLSFSLD